MKRISTYRTQLAILLTVFCVAISPLIAQVHAQTPGAADPPPPAEVPPPPAEDPPPPPAEVPPPPVQEPPVEAPPVDSPPAEEPPVEEPPVDNPPAEQLPVDDASTPDDSTDDSAETETPTTDVTEEPMVEDVATPTFEVEEELTPATPTPTEEVNPVVTWSQTEQVRCELRDGQASGLKYAESRTYHCEVSANVVSDIAMPGDMEIKWIVDVDFPDSHVLQFPQGSSSSVTEQVPGPTATATTYSITHPWQQGDVQMLVFDLVVTRNTCAVGEQVLRVQTSPEFRTSASEAEIKRQDGNIQPPPVSVVSPVIESAAPVVSFDGPITFESISATTAGFDSEVSHGMATIVVSGDWDPCTSWSIDVSGTAALPADAPAQLRVVSINNESVTGDVCDLSAPCDLIVLPEVGDAATPLRYTIGLELQLHELTPVGSFGIELLTEIQGGEINP